MKIKCSRLKRDAILSGLIGTLSQLTEAVFLSDNTELQTYCSGEGLRNILLSI